MDRPPHTLRFAVIATDTVAFSVGEGALRVLLVRMTNPQYAGMQGLPGGLIAPDETADDAARRHLRHKGGLEVSYLDQLYTFSRVDRDPRGRVVAVAYMALVPEADAVLDVDGAQWVPVKKMPKLAYDHSEIVETALARLSARLGYTTIAAHLLPREFTLTELQTVYEIILGRVLDKRNFRKKLLELHIVKATGRQRRGGANRPAELFTFASRTTKVVNIL